MGYLEYDKLPGLCGRWVSCTVGTAVGFAVWDFLPGSPPDLVSGLLEPQPSSDQVSLPADHLHELRMTHHSASELLRPLGSWTPLAPCL